MPRATKLGAALLILVCYSHNGLSVTYRYARWLMADGARWYLYRAIGRNHVMLHAHSSASSLIAVSQFGLARALQTFKFPLTSHDSHESRLSSLFQSLALSECAHCQSYFSYYCFIIQRCGIRSDFYFRS